MNLSPAEQIAADLVWKTFSASGQWTERHRLVLALDDAGFTLHDAHRVLRGVSTSPSYDSPSKERAHLTLAGFVAVGAAQDVLRPLGHVVASLARAFIENPVPQDASNSGVAWSSFRDLWPTDDAWQQISAIIRAGLDGPLSWSSQTPTETSLRPSIELLRYEQVQTVEDVLRVSETFHRRTRVGSHPAGRHREFLLRVFAHARSKNTWPSALPFAVAQRDLGFVPDIQRDLSSEGYVRGEFSPHSYAHIELTPASVNTIDVSGEGKELLLRVLAECRSRWRAAPGADVMSTQLANALAVEEATLKPWLLFLDSCEWKSVSTLSGAGEWSLRPNELILRYRDVTSWDDYLAVPNRDRGSGLWLGAAVQGAGESQQTPPDLSGAKGRLGRLLRHQQLASVIESRLEEFDRAFAAQAWQAAMILLGSAMEGVLLDVLGRNAGKAESALPSRKRSLSDAGLGDLVHAAESLKLVNAQVKALAAGLKEFRDLVHPNRAAASTWRPTPEAVRGCAIAFENLVVEMEQAIDDGRMKTFEQS